MAPLRKTYVLKLYVAGNTANSVRALKTLNNILEKEFKGVYALKVIDVLKNPQLAEEDKILATPTLAKVLPPPCAASLVICPTERRCSLAWTCCMKKLASQRMMISAWNRRSG